MENKSRIKISGQKMQTALEAYIKFIRVIKSMTDDDLLEFEIALMRVKHEMEKRHE